MKYSVLIWILGFFCSSAVVAEQPVAEAGKHYVLYQKHDVTIKQATLFYRREGSRQFLQQAMIKQGNEWRAELSGFQMQTPGIEYYVSFEFFDGSHETDPLQYPEYNPYRVQVVAQKPVQILLDQAFVGEARNKIIFRLNNTGDEPLRFHLGELDVSDFVQRNNDEWILSNEAGLFSGDVLLKVTTDNGRLLASQRVSFAAEAGKSELQPAKNRELVLRGNASINLGTQNSSEQISALSLNGNLHVETEYKQDDFSSHFSGINVNYQYEADPEFNLSSGFLLTNTYKDHSLLLGDVSVRGTPLVMSGFARRGLVYQTKTNTGSGSIFNVRTAPVEGWESGISFDDRQTYGLAWEQKMGESSDSSIQLALVSGRLQPNASSNVGTQQSVAQKGDTLGVQWAAEWGGFNMMAQLASSEFDADTSDALVAEKDNAYEVQVQRTIYGLSSSIGFHRYGQHYATIANPNFSNDRSGLDLSVGSQWQALGWTGFFSRTRDNVDDDPARPVVYSDNSGLNLNLTIQHWPALTLGFNVSQQRSQNEPDVTQQLSNNGQDVTLGIAHTFSAFAVSWNTSVGELIDDLDATKNSETRNNALNLTYQGDTTRINVNVSKNRNISQVEQVSDLVSLSFDVPLFADDIVLNSQFSYQRNTASDLSQDNEIVGGGARVSWNVGDMWSSAPKWVSNGRFSLSWSFNKTKDAFDPANDTDDSRILLEFGLGAPVAFENRWTF